VSTTEGLALGSCPIPSILTDLEWTLWRMRGFEMGRLSAPMGSLDGEIG
jgi:hypothetical protein